MQELIPPIGSQAVEGEVTNESLVRQSGWGADNDAMPGLNSGARCAPVSEKVTISQRDMKCSTSYKEGNDLRPVSLAANGRKCFFQDHDLESHGRNKDNLDDPSHPFREIESKRRRETVRVNVEGRSPTAKNDKVSFHEERSRVSPYNKKPEQLTPHKIIY